jgi:UDP-N-acetylmuramoyl-L-alanyl-D-glutamate--2,6-diaminopimelate ligase
VSLVIVDSTRKAVGPLAQAFYDWPARKLTCIGVTGTNGKTTVTSLICAILARAGHSAGLVGTIAYQTGKRDQKAATTTPDPITLAELAAEMVTEGRSHLVMEVSSHALDQDRAAGLRFAAAAFTNLTGDHLDYHKTMDSYRDAKLRLFSQLDRRAVAVINRDDPAAEAFLTAAAPAGRTISYGLSAAADIWARIDRIDASGTHFVLQQGGRQTPVQTRLIGRHNVYNCLAAAGVCLGLGLEEAVIVEALAATGNVRGRLERVTVPAPYSVFVDYAHTDDALTNVLATLREMTSGRVFVVFGCGGDRDRAKRPLMGRACAEKADYLVVTSDNPRTEEPSAIIGEILAGIPAGTAMTVEPDRRAAIRAALALAGPGDVVLVAGKGHEPFQELAGRTIPFDDRQVAAEEAEKLGVRK